MSIATKNLREIGALVNGDNTELTELHAHHLCTVMRRGEEGLEEVRNALLESLSSGDPKVNAWSQDALLSMITTSSDSRIIEPVQSIMLNIMSSDKTEAKERIGNVVSFALIMGSYNGPVAAFIKRVNEGTDEESKRIITKSVERAKVPHNRRLEYLDSLVRK